MQKNKFKNIMYYLLSSIVFVAAFNEPMEMVFVKIIKESFTDLKSKGGTLDMQFYKNFPSSGIQQNQILTLYKGENSSIVELKKEYSKPETWFSNDSGMKIIIDNNNNLNALGNPDKSNIIGIFSNSSSLVNINRLKRDETQPLLIKTSYEYYIENLKNIFGASFSIGALVFISVTGYYSNKKIRRTKAVKKKDVIVFN